MLLLSYAFPPMAEPEAALAAKRLANLSGYDVTVLCATPFGGAEGTDHSLDEYVGENFRSVQRVAMPWWARSVPFHRLGLVGRIPDMLRFANRKAERAARALDVGGFDALMTWSQWHSIHLVGLRLKRRFPDLPWIAHFSDPWTDNPFLAAHAMTRGLNRRMESAVLQSADALLFTATDTLDLVLRGERQSLRGKAQVLPHAFEAGLYPPVAPEATVKLVVRYVGRFYGPRSPQPLLLAIARLQETDPVVLEGVRVELVGWTEPGMLSGAAVRDLPAGMVIQREPVDYRTSLSLMRSAAVLVVVDAPFEHSVFLPSKLVDYLGARRPVVGITPPGAAAALIERYGGWVAAPDDIDGVAHALRQALAAARVLGVEDFGEPAVRAEYDARQVGARLTTLITALAHQQPEFGACRSKTF